MGSYNYLKLSRKLKKLGFQFYRQGKGSHALWVNNESGILLPIPRHGGKDIRHGTLQAIIKQVGLKNMKELDEL